MRGQEAGRRREEGALVRKSYFYRNSHCMSLFNILALVITLSAVFGYINVRLLKLPITIGLMIIAILFSVASLVIGRFYPALLTVERQLIEQIDFYDVLMNGMLSFLLFAGALHVDFARLRAMAAPIAIFATLGVAASTLLVGTAVYFLLPLLGMSVPFVYCLLFGALISPTDPIAVLGILKRARAPQQLEMKIVGESLFNDGIGVVVFLTILQFARAGGGEIEFSEIGFLFLHEVGGGLLLGALIGYAAYWLMRRIDHYEVEVMITLAVVMGGYALAAFLHFSGPLAMVAAGLLIGNERFRTTSMSATTELYVDKFWELMDMLLNAILFVLIGLELVALTFSGSYLLAGILAIPIVLLARYLSLAPPVALFSRQLDFAPRTSLIMTWGGLRGGISIALALSLPTFVPRDLFITMTYAIVVFSIIVQGLTVGTLVRKVAEQGELPFEGPGKRDEE